MPGSWVGHPSAAAAERRGWVKQSPSGPKVYPKSSLLRRRAERAGRPLAARTRPRRRSPSGQLGSPARIAIQANGIALDGIDPEANVIHWADIASKRLLASIVFGGIDPEAMGIRWTEIASK